jgi:hypothetical protein
MLINTKVPATPENLSKPVKTCQNLSKPVIRGQPSFEKQSKYINRAVSPFRMRVRFGAITK